MAQITVYASGFNNAIPSGFGFQLGNPSLAVGSTTGDFATGNASQTAANSIAGNHYYFAGLSAIPAGSTITSVTLEVSDSVSNTTRGNYGYRLDSAPDTQIATEWAPTGVTTLTTQSNATWSTLPTAAQLLASTFGVRARFTRSATQAVTYNLDWLRLTVVYTPPSQAVSPTGFSDTEDFGVPTINVGSTSLDIAPTGASDTELFGTSAMSLDAVSTGFADTELFGVPSVAIRPAPTGFADAEGFGAQNVAQLRVNQTGFTDTELFGTESVQIRAAQTGFAEVELFGNNPALVLLTAGGYAETEGIGSPSIDTSSGTPVERAMHVTFDDPTRFLRAQAAQQEWRIHARRAFGTSSLSVRVELWEAGNPTALSVVVPETPVTGETVLVGQWDSALLSEASGADVEARVIATSADPVRLQIAGWEWNTYEVSSPVVTAGDTLVASWNVAELTGDTLNSRYNVRATTGDSVTALWNVRELAVDILTSRWHVRQLTRDTLDSAWKIFIGGIGETLSSNWLVRRLAGETLLSRWNVQSFQITPDKRGFYVEAEDRGYLVAADDRGFYVEAEDRGYTFEPVTPDERGIYVEADDRGYLVPPDNRGFYVVFEDRGYLVTPHDRGFFVVFEDRGIRVLPEEREIIIPSEDRGYLVQPQS